MNFDLNDEQTMLKATVERLLADRYRFEARRRLIGDELGWSRETWSLFAEQGFLAAPFAEADGGLGGGPVETMILAEAFGSHLIAEPYLACVIMGGAALRYSPNAALRPALIAQVAAGKVLLAFADDEPAMRSGAADPKLAARKDGDCWVLEGAKVGVLHGGCADHLVVTARTENGVGIFLVDASSSGISRRAYRTFDGLCAADIRFDKTPASAVLAAAGEGETLAERVRQNAIAYMAAEATGLMSMLLDASVGHLKTRRQFGQTLSSQQALKHRAAEMLVALEQVRSMAIYATMMLDEDDAVERRKAFAAVKSVIGLLGVEVGQAAVQLHGGLGVTDEHRIGWALRRLHMIDLSFADAQSWAGELGRLGGFVAAD
ncbi:MAG: acyl-CoA dehydrogenase family protein [Rhizomicrobium sp.]